MSYGKKLNNRIIITSIRIKNFRSIKNALIKVKDMNIFVGLNDVGKSNVLKALNLFFNGNTDYDTPFDFKKDFSCFFTKKSHKTKEIVIKIEFKIPETYKEHGIYTWEKRWKSDNYTEETILNQDGKKPTERSRVPGTLKRIKYRYVPAVKSKEYYKSLLVDLYDTASSVLDNPLGQSIQDFSKVIQNYTNQIHKEVNERIGIDSRLSIPQNLSELFKTLIFQTVVEDRDSLIPLDMRGDGIQARHIPIILKYIADEDQKTRNQGSMKVNTIWGFEEPENGMELSKAFELADDFLEYTDSIQMFITTHSPAFYMKKNDIRTQIFYITQNEGTKISTTVNYMYIGETMGLMPIVAPYIEEQEKKIKEARKLLEENLLYDIPTIMVEGKTDKQYLQLAIKLFSPRLYDLLENNKLRIFTKNSEAGCKKVVEWALAWIFSGNKSKAMVLFDKDEAGIKAHNELCNNDIYKKKNPEIKLKVQYLQPSENILCLNNQEVNIFYEIEHLFSVKCWGKIKDKDYAELRDITELSKIFQKFLTRSEGIDQVIKRTVQENELIETIINWNPHKDKKERIFRFINNSNEEEQREYLCGLKNTIDKLEIFFCRE